METNRNRPNSAVTIQSAISSRGFNKPPIKVQKHFQSNSLNLRHKSVDTSLPTHIPHDVIERQDNINQLEPKKGLQINSMKRKIVPTENLKQTLKRKETKFKNDIKGLSSKELQLQLESIGSRLTAFEKTLLPIPKSKKQTKIKIKQKSSEIRPQRKLPSVNLEYPTYCPEDYTEDIVKQKEQVLDRVSKLLIMSNVPNSLSYQLASKQDNESVSDTRALLKKIKDELESWRLEHPEEDNRRSYRNVMMSDDSRHSCRNVMTSDVCDVDVEEDIPGLPVTEEGSKKGQDEESLNSFFREITILRHDQTLETRLNHY